MIEIREVKSGKEFKRFVESRLKTENVNIITDKQAIDRNLANDTILVFGTPTGNLWFVKHFPRLPVQITPEQIMADTVYPGTNLRFITTWPNPQNPAKGVVIYTAQRAEDIININNVTHGVTDYVITMETEILKSGDYNKQKSPWTIK